MPTFDVVSEVDLQEVRNAVDQARKEVTTRYDFKDTGSTIELEGHEIRLHSSTEDRMKALVQVVEEKLVRREVPLKSLDYGKVEDATKGTVRQTLTIQSGISSENAKKVTKLIRDTGLKGIQAQIQGDQVRVSGKKRDDLQAVIAALKAEDLGIALQFTNFRD